MLIHGLRGSHHGLRPIADELKNDFEVFTPDIPGSGDSPELVRQDLAGHIKWLHEYVAALPTKPIVLGHSMGSIIVSHYVRAYPQDVARQVILLSPIIRGEAGEFFSKLGYGGFRVALSPFDESRRHKILANWRVSWLVSHFLTHDKKKQEYIDQEHYKHSGKFASARSLIGDVKISMTKETIVPQKKDVLLIFGKWDRLTSSKLTKKIAREFDVDYYEIESAGHLLNYENPKDVAEAIRAFLGRDK